MVYLKEVSVTVDLPDEVGYFVIISPSRAPFVAGPDKSTRLPGHLKQYAKIALLSKTILAATNELRELLRPVGTIYPTLFEYSLKASDHRPALFIRDNDPVNHRDIGIGCYTYNLYMGDARSAKFRDALASSKFVEQMPQWDGMEITVRLKPAYAQPSRLLDTFASLVKLF